MIICTLLTPIEWKLAWMHTCDTLILHPNSGGFSETARNPCSNKAYGLRHDSKSVLVTWPVIARVGSFNGLSLCEHWWPGKLSTAIVILHTRPGRVGQFWKWCPYRFWFRYLILWTRGTWIRSTSPAWVHDLFLIESLSYFIQSKRAHLPAYRAVSRLLFGLFARVNTDT